MLGAGGDEHEVGGEAEHEPERGCIQATSDRQREAPADVEQLDRRRRGSSRRRARRSATCERLAHPRLADHGAEEGRAAADQPEQRRGSASSAARPRRPAGRRCRSPRSRCAAPKPMIRTSASATSSGAADWPIASPSPKLCRPIPVAIRSASRAAGRQRSIHDAMLELVDRGGARADERRRARACHPAVVVDEAHQADARSRRRAARASRAKRPQSCARRAAASTGSTPCESTSQSRKSRIPVATARQRRAQRRPSRRRRGRSAGRGRSSKPAIAPRTRVWVVLTCKAHLTDGRAGAYQSSRLWSAMARALGRRVPGDDLLPRVPDRRVPPAGHRLARRSPRASPRCSASRAPRPARC